MTEKTIKALDDFVTREIKKLGVDVGRHSFFISKGPYTGRKDKDIFRLDPREYFQLLTDDSPKEDLGPLMALMAQTLYEYYADDIDYEKDFNGTYFLSKSLWQYMWDLEELWKKGIPGRIAYDPEYVLDGRKHPENYCLIECRCGKLIMVPRYTGDMILETTCPICDLPWQYENERPKYPYCDGMYGVVCDYTPVYKIPK